MRKQLIVNANYNGLDVSFTGDGWFNATEAAKRFGKEPYMWLRQRETVEYISTLSEMNGNSVFVEDFNKIIELDSTSSLSQVKLIGLTKKTGFVKVKNGSPENGGGTWFHPDLAVPFARWLDVRFSIWCDRQIRQLLTGTHPHSDWQRMRHEAASSFKVMAAIVKMNLEAHGQTPCPYHFSNEARLVNWALTGEFCKIDRETLPSHELDLLAQLENFNSVLAGSNHSYDYRKQALQAFALTLRSRVMLKGVAA
jgi:hypothetical protein